MQSFGRHLLSLPTRRVINACHVRPLRELHASAIAQVPRKRNFFSSNAALQQEANLNKDASSNLRDSGTGNKTIKEILSAHKRKPVRSPPGKTSLRRVAVEAQRSRNTVQKQDAIEKGDGSNMVRAISVADQFDMDAVMRILRSHGFSIDPDGTGFDSEEVIHARGASNGDIFVFDSGSVVAWSLTDDGASDLATKFLLPAAVDPHMDQMETEDLEYQEDAKRDNGFVKGDVIVLGTKADSGVQDSRVDNTLAKIAFSSGLARSTKIAVLESALEKYFKSTRSIPILLSQGAKLPFDRKFMQQKTGELLVLRAQLNHYSELTDSLPDLFWDSKHELGLEEYYDQVGRALDVNIRIKTLNQKLDYAQDIAKILSETLSEKHSIYLEWIIIILIAVEVAFGLLGMWEKRRIRLAKGEEPVKLIPSGWNDF